MSSKNRKLYQMGDMSIREFYAHNTRWLAESTTPESVFEKPYLDEDRGRMHADPSVPDWPSPGPPGPSPPPMEGPVPGLTLCAITCYEPLSDCKEPIWCHQSIWCGHDPQCHLCTWTVEGATTGYSWRRMVGGTPDTFWGINIWIDENLLVDGKALIHVQMKDPCGNLCGEDLEVVCKVCPPEVVVSWDRDASAETIAASSSVGVCVKDGLGPYEWSVVGTGFTMLHASTEGVSNSLVGDASACGSAVITVTDFCEDTTVGYVRGTTGQWVWKAAACVVSGVGVFMNYAAPQCNYELIIDNKRQFQSTRLIGTCTGDGCCDPYCDNAAYCVTGTSCANCIDPFDHSCAPYDQFPHGYLHTPPDKWSCACPSAFVYQEWEC